MVDKHPVNPFIQFIQFSLTAGVCGVGGFSIYAYLNGYGLIGDGGIIPLIGCGVSCFAAFWAFLAILSRTALFHFGVAKLFLAGLIVTAWGSATVANWVCSDEGERGRGSCDPAALAPDGWVTGIVTAAFDGVLLILFLATCIVCVRNPKRRPLIETSGSRTAEFLAEIRDDAFHESVEGMNRAMDRAGDRINGATTQAMYDLRYLV